MSQFSIDIPLSASSVDMRGLVSKFYDSQITPTELMKPPSQSFIFLRDDQQKICGGAYVDFMYDICSIAGFWVAPELRKQGHGARIYRTTEDLAYLKKRKRLLLSTFEFQNSIRFWEKMGFSKFAELPDCAEGSRLFYMRKTISEK